MAREAPPMVSEQCRRQPTKERYPDSWNRHVTPAPAATPFSGHFLVRPSVPGPPRLSRGASGPVCVCQCPSHHPRSPAHEQPPRRSYPSPRSLPRDTANCSAASSRPLCLVANSSPPWSRPRCFPRDSTVYPAAGSPNLSVCSAVVGCPGRRRRRSICRRVGCDSWCGCRYWCASWGFCGSARECERRY